MTSVTAGSRARGTAVLAWVAALAAALAVMAWSAPAATAAGFGIEPGGFVVEPSTTQAGAHPDVRVRFKLNDDGATPPVPFDTARNIVVDLPPGVVGDPNATPRCKGHEWPNCPANTQVGTIRVTAAPGGVWQLFTAPVYNLVPAHGHPAEFGFQAFILNVRLLLSVRGEDHGLRTEINTLPVIGPLLESDLTFWGVPADPSHDPERGRKCTQAFGGPPGCFPTGGLPSDQPRRPFMRNAATCDGPGTARLALDSYENPGVYDRAETTYPQLTGCATQQFAGGGTVRADDPTAGAPSGYAVELTVPQGADPDGLATPPLEKAVVTLPEGTVVSPSAADGLKSCGDAQLRLGDASAPDCPPASKIGAVEIDSPLMSAPMVGGAYLMEQTPAQLLRLALVVEGAGVRLKLLGRIEPDPVTGRLTTTFEGQPQLPFRTLRLRLKGGARAVLSNPRGCGPATSTVALTPYGGGPTVTSTDTFEISGDGSGAGCASGFAPTVSAGSATAVGGAATTFSLRVARGDGDDALGALDVTLPAGLVPSIADVPVCQEAQALAGTCGEESRVGSVATAVGPGAKPFSIPGRVYLGGPHRGAPYSLVIVVPAVAGPLDLGTVVVRAAVHVDRHTAALRVVSDALPTILRGIPLQIRSFDVAIDRPGFMLNPTSCAPRAITASVAAAGGAVAERSVRFKVGDCARLRYAPRLAVKVGAKGRTAGGQRVPLTATLTQAAGQAASRRVRLVLPGVLNARLEIVRRACSQAAYDAGSCGEAARVGSAVARTPVLGSALSGSAYFVRNPARSLPDLVVQLRGDGIAIDLVGTVAINRSLQLTTTFDAIPDVPLSRFELTLPARLSPVGATRSLCTKASRRATTRQTLRGHNGKLVQRKVPLTIAGCKAATGRATS